MSVSGLPAERPAIADTVVVNYFLAVGAFELLRVMLGGVVQVPRAVFDPDEPDDIAEEAASELRRGLRFHRRRAADTAIRDELRQRSQRALPRFEGLPGLVADGSLVVVSLEPEELGTYAQLRDPEYVATFARVAGLGRGEAAALAIASTRGCPLATDDEDAITVAAALRPDIEVLRVRGILRAAAVSGAIGWDEARDTHAAMIAAGFWDTGRIE